MRKKQKIIVVPYCEVHGCNAPHYSPRIIYITYHLTESTFFILGDDEYDWANNKWYSKKYERYMFNGNLIKYTDSKVIVTILQSIAKQWSIKNKNRELIIKFQLAWNLLS